MLKSRLAAIRAARGKEGGFTLIELLVVVVILVALAAIAIPVYLNQKIEADQAAAKATVATTAQFLAAGIAAGQLNPADQAITTAAAGGDTIDAGVNGTMVVPEGYKYKWVQYPDGDFCVSSPSIAGETFKYDQDSGGVIAGACA